jgi:hypothetical protein
MGDQFAYTAVRRNAASYQQLSPGSRPKNCGIGQHRILVWNSLSDEILPTANSPLPDDVRSDDLGDNDQLASSGFR